MHHDKTAIAALQIYVMQQILDFVLIQERWLVDRDWECLFPIEDQPRVRILSKKRHNLGRLWGYSTRDVMAWSMRFLMEENLKHLTIGSAYVPFNSNKPPPTKEVRKLVEDCKDQGTKLVLGCDSTRTISYVEALESTNDASHF